MTQPQPSAFARALFEESGDALFLLDPDTDRLLDVNPVALRLTGFDRAELMGFPATQLFRVEAGGGPQRVREAFTKTVVFHARDGFFLRCKGVAAGWFPVTLSVSRLHVAPKPLGLIVARDDRERRAALAQARRVEAELRNVLTSSPAALWSAERPPGPDALAGWQFRYVSDHLARIAGRGPGAFESPFQWADVVHPADRDAYRAAVRGLLAGAEEAAEQAYRVVRPGGEVRWARDRLRVVRDAAGRPARLDGCVADITAERDGEEAVRRSERRFRTLVEKSRDGLLLLDEEGVIRYASPAAKTVLGYDPDGLVGQRGTAFVHPDDLPEARDKLAYTLARPGEEVPSRLRAVAADGTVRRLEVSGCNRLADPSVQAVVVHYRDVTERDHWESALRESQKLEAVGRLAGGVAHDFNNLLTVVLGNLELVRGGAAAAEVPELLAGAERAARQAADVTRQMLGFARRQPVRPTAVDLNGLARDALTLLRRSIDPHVAVHFHGLTGLPPAAADPVQVQQVLMNLFLNARDAMPEGGVLTVETGRAAALPDGTGADRPDGFARLSVSDTGVGMAEEVRARVFEPFFTTKDVGKGTGLGLAVVYGVATAHGGAVTCASTPGQGTRFDVYLPCAPVTPPPAAAEAVPPLTDDGRGELVLVADDEPAVRELAKAGLELHGFRVVTAADGAEAVEVARREGAVVRLAVLDATMPRLTGRQAFDAIRAFAPDLPVVFASGYAAAKLLADPPPPRTSFLPKPYTPVQLAAEVRRLLDTTAGAPADGAGRDRPPGG
jgi:PAS domain S-box-containing protein